MTTAPTKFRVGSATIVFGVLSAFFLLSHSLIFEPRAIAAKLPPGTGVWAAVRFTIPLFGVTAIALWTINATQSEKQSWIFAGLAFVIALIIYGAWISHLALGFA